jgi:hypothetical protein
MASWNEDRVASALGELGNRIEVAESPDLAARVVARIEAGDSRRQEPSYVRRTPAFAAAAVILVAALSSLLVPQVREAVADWLGVGGVRIERRPAPTPPGELGDDLFLGDPATLADARERVGFDIGIPAALGDPDEVFLEEVSGHLRVSMLWEARPGLPEAKETGVGALLVEVPGAIGEFAAKMAESDFPIREVSVSGARGVWLRGDHFFFYTDPEGAAIEESIRLATNTLLWEDNGVTFRLEGAFTLRTALQIAESIP